MGISGIFILVEFGGILRLVESGGFLRYRVNISRNSKFQFGVRVIHYKTFLLITGGGK